MVSPPRREPRPPDDGRKRTRPGCSTWTVTATLTDSVGAQLVRTYTLVINGPPTITPTSASTKKNKDFSIPLTVGGTGPYTYTITPAPHALPSWAILDLSAGTLSSTNTPTSTGSFTFTINVTDAAGATRSTTFTLTLT